MVSGAQSILVGWLLVGSWCWVVWVYFFVVWGVVGCVFAGGGIVWVGGVFGDTAVGWFLRGVVTPHPRVAYLVFSVVQYLYGVERKSSNQTTT